MGNSTQPPMATRFLLSLFLLVSSLLSSSASIDRSLSALEAVGKKQKEFDYFVLSLLWPGTPCKSTSHCCPSNGCCLKSGPLTEFTIHGLWANYNDNTWPSCCNPNPSFDLKKIFSLLGTMQKYWPTFGCSSSSDCHGGKGLFWQHEWEKHGTCSSPVINDEYSYFTTALDLYFKYNMTKVLCNAGFVASNEQKYKLEDVVAAVEQAVGATPTLACSHGAVEELRLCFYKDYKPRDCTVESSCPAYISLPTYHTPVSEEEGAQIEWLQTDEAFKSLAKLSVM